jgi:hypothetical protein
VFTRILTPDASPEEPNTTKIPGWTVSIAVAEELPNVAVS